MFSFSPIDRRTLTIALWLAISVSALCGRPLHELEHVPGDHVGAAPTCSCSHLHGHHHGRSAYDDDKGQHSGQPDSSHSHQHGNCQICLTLWLQAPFQAVVPEVQSLGALADRVLFDNDRAARFTVQIANARGPPADV